MSAEAKHRSTGENAKLAMITTENIKLPESICLEKFDRHIAGRFRKWFEAELRI